MYIHRQLEEKIKPFLKRKEAIAIIGPRQAGKTTFLKFLENNYKKAGKRTHFITFENRDDLNLFQDSVEDFKSLYKNYQVIIIDEFQYAKDGGQKLKYLYDTTNIKFIVSGSSSLELSFQTGKYMVGRILNFNLLPFSFREFLSFRDKDLSRLLNQKIKADSLLSFSVKGGFGASVNKKLGEELEKYAIYGGYPAAALASSEKEKQKILSGIIGNYLLKDIKGLLHLATERELLALAKFLAAQIGGMIKYEELSTVSGLSYKELLKHLNILEKTFFVDLIRPFFKNRRVELVKNPKVYFRDTGARNFLLSDFRTFKTRADQGALMENYAYNMLENMELTEEIKYWRTKSQAEVDFIIEKQGDVYPIEIKYSSKEIIGKSFYSFVEKFKPKIGIILTKDYLAEKKIQNTKIKFIPLCYF